jgi:hypothetical protein
LLPRLLHRALRRADADAAAARRQQRAPWSADERRRPNARLEQLVIGGALLIAGVLWTGLASPPWLGWAGAVIGLGVLAFAPRRG